MRNWDPRTSKYKYKTHLIPLLRLQKNDELRSENSEGSREAVDSNVVKITRM